MAEALKSVAAVAVSAVTGMPPHPAPPSSQYLRWDASGVEDVKPDEDQKASQIADVMNQMQKLNFAKHRHAFRATHVKSQGIVKGTLTVLPDLPQHLQQGMFSEPGQKYDVAARYANEPIFIQADQAPAPRGLGMKVFGVTGTRLDPDDNSTTQDWLFNNAPELELTDIDTTLDIMSLRLKYFDEPLKLGAALKLRKDAIKQHAPYMLPNTNLISNEFFSQSAFRFGDYYGHVGLFPVHESQKTERATENVPSQNHDVLSDWLLDYFNMDDAEYDLRVQLGTDIAHHPTEDASIAWSDKTSPWQTVAKVHFPKQNSFSQARRTFWDDEMTLSPWRCLKTHQPLGSVNRLRKYVYRRSKERRDEINSKKSHNVDKIEQIPD